MVGSHGRTLSTSDVPCLYIRGMTSGVIAPWRAGEADSFPDLLAEGATFSSPVADYHGRDDAAHVMGLIARVLEDVTPETAWGTERDTVGVFRADVDGAPVEGIVREQRDAAGALVHVTLFLRPYRTLGVAISRMGQLMSDDPLPSRRA